MNTDQVQEIIDFLRAQKVNMKSDFREDAEDIFGVMANRRHAEEKNKHVDKLISYLKDFMWGLR